MPQVHTIRLRGPWELTPLATTQQQEMLPGDEPQGFASESVTQQMPAAWDAVLPDYCGTVRYTRRFGKPTNLEVHERVRLVLDQIAGSAVVLLNGKKVPDTFFITELLGERNLLQIDVTQLDPNQPAGLVGEVRLEIRVADSLRESEPI